jgi:hypothetical protein
LPRQRARTDPGTFCLQDKPRLISTRAIPSVGPFALTLDQGAQQLDAADVQAVWAVEALHDF